MQGGLRGSVQSKGWAGEESWQEEIPQKKLGYNTNGRITKPCSAADSDNQAATFSSRPPNAEAEVTVDAASTSASLNSCVQPEPAPHEQGGSQALWAWKLPSILNWEICTNMRSYDAILFSGRVYLAPLQWDPTHLTL